jgi:glycolate oxidase FAD binding subunit
MHTPQSEEELAEIIRRGKPIHAVGNGTKQHHGPPPAPDAETVHLWNLNRILAYEPGDLVVSVQAGAKLADVQATLAREGQWLPLDPPYPDATLGGILATNSSGPRRLAYGTARDLLLGLRVIGPDGTATRSGGRVVKNVTGYDLHKLHIGAFGTLGVLTEASFKLRPKPEASAAVVFPCASVPEAHELCLQIFASKLRPVALEAIDRRLRHVVDAPALAVVGVEGSRAVLDRHFRDLRELGRPLGVLEGDRAEPVWTALKKLPEALKDFVRVRIGAKPQDLPKVLPSAPLWVRAGTGLAWADLDPTSEVAKKVVEWHHKAASVGGYAIVESAPFDLPGREKLPWAVAPDPLGRMLAQSRDPLRHLNPGRMAV